MTRTATRLIVALLAEWLCHKLDPQWKYKRAVRRAFTSISRVLAGAEGAIRDLTTTIQRTSESFARFAQEMEGDADS